MAKTSAPTSSSHGRNVIEISISRSLGTNTDGPKCLPTEDAYRSNQVVSKPSKCPPCAHACTCMAAPPPPLLPDCALVQRGDTSYTVYSRGWYGAVSGLDGLRYWIPQRFQFLPHWEQQRVGIRSVGQRSLPDATMKPGC